MATRHENDFGFNVGGGDQDSAQQQLRDVRGSAVQSREQRRRAQWWLSQLRSAYRRHHVVALSTANCVGEKKSGLSLDRPLFLLAVPTDLLNRVDHVEDRQVHRHHHAADHDAEEHDHDRLEQ